MAGRAGRYVRCAAGGAMAETMGVSTAWMRVGIFVYAAVLASISGVLFAHLQRAVNPTPIGLNHGIEFLFMAVVGGVTHVWGAVLGAAILTILQDYRQMLLPRPLGQGGNFEVVVFGVLRVLSLQHAQRGVWLSVARLFPRGPQAPIPEQAEFLPQRKAGCRRNAAGRGEGSQATRRSGGGERCQFRAKDRPGYRPDRSERRREIRAAQRERGALQDSGHAKGAIVYQNRDVRAVPVEKRVARGMRLVPCPRETGAVCDYEASRTTRCLAPIGANGAGERHCLDQLGPVLTLFPRLKERRRQAAGTRSGGERQMLAVWDAR